MKSISSSEPSSITPATALSEKQQGSSLIPTKQTSMQWTAGVVYKTYSLTLITLPSEALPSQTPAWPCQPHHSAPSTPGSTLVKIPWFPKSAVLPQTSLPLPMLFPLPGTYCTLNLTHLPGPASSFPALSSPPSLLLLYSAEGRICFSLFPQFPVHSTEQKTVPFTDGHGPSKARALREAAVGCLRSLTPHTSRNWTVLLMAAILSSSCLFFSISALLYSRWALMPLAWLSAACSFSSKKTITLAWAFLTAARSSPNCISATALTSDTDTWWGDGVEGSQALLSEASNLIEAQHTEMSA